MTRSQIYTEFIELQNISIKDKGEQIMDDLDNILSNIDLEEEKQDAKGDYADEWWCTDCEHGPMDEKDDKCDRCGEPHPTMKKRDTTNEDGWEDENIEAELEEIY